MYSDLDKSSKGRSFFIFIIGALVLAAGLIGMKPSLSIFNIIYLELSQASSPYNNINLLYAALWITAAVATCIAGLSLIISAITRKQADLIPGPTLYFLGLSLAVIGGFLFMGGLSWQAAVAASIGGLLIYWEWSYHVI